MSDLRLWPDSILAHPAIETHWLSRNEMLHTAPLPRRAVADLALLGIAANQIGRDGRTILDRRPSVGPSARLLLPVSCRRSRNAAA